MDVEVVVEARAQVDVETVVEEDVEIDVGV